MKSLRTLGVLVVLLGGLAAYLYYVDAEKPVGETEEKPKVFAVEADQIEELKVSTIAGGAAELKKSADGWYLTKPQHLRADDSEVTGITSNLASVSIQRVVDENPSNLGDYGLREPLAEVSFKAKGAKQFKTLQIGTKTPAGSDMYAKTADDKKVFLVFGYLESSLNRTPFDLRDKKIISFDREKVDRIEIRHGSSLVSLVKASGEWRMTAPVEARADFGAIEGLISKLQSAQMKAIVTEDPAEFDKYGITPPSAEVTIVSGSAKAAMAFGSKTADNFIHVRDLSKSLVVTAPADLFDEIEKGPGEYRRKDLFEFRAFNLDRLEITRDTTTVTFERLKGKGKDGADAWQNAVTSKAVDAAKFEAFLTKLSGTRAQSFVDEKTKAGMDAPVVTVKATFDEGKKSETVTIGRVGAEVFSGRTDEPGAAKLDATEVDETLKALDEFK
ncbi:MAG: DUF4340 domain-containing protein [Vicinamibacteria bacterium]|nr:DUF4340 domain-containing protein [Vicinamibacteria bacterium]